MYAINEVPLDNADFGWRLLRRSQLITDVVKNLSNVTIPGRHGVLGGVPSFSGSPTATLVVRGPGQSVEALYALFMQAGGTGVLTLEDDTSRAAAFELASISTNGITAFDELVDTTVTIRFPSADWRATAVTEFGLATVTDVVQEFQTLVGIGMDITDMDIFIGGDFGNFQLEDMPTGAWLKTVQTWPYVASTGLLYVGATGQAFRANTSAPWTPTADMSDYVDVSGGGGFRITPAIIGNDPSDRLARVELTVTATSGVTFGIRAYNAYAIRNGEI